MLEYDLVYDEGVVVSTHEISGDEPSLYERILDAEVVKAAGGAVYYPSLSENGKLRILTSLDQAEVDGIYAAWKAVMENSGVSLRNAKRQRHREIDHVTLTRTLTFEHAGLVFSWDDDRMNELQGVMNIANSSVPWSPVPWPSHTTVHTLTTVADAESFAAAAFVAVSTEKITANGYKAAVDALTTVAQVLAWSDPRL